MILRILKRLMVWLTSKQRAETEEARKEAVAQFVHETLPSRDEAFVDRLIVENGTFNYFVLPSGKLPTFNYVMPELPLFIIILTPENSEWEVAEQYGVTKEVWEKAVAEKAALKQGVMDMPMSERPIPPLFWELAWNVPTDQNSLLEDFRTKVRRKR